MTIVFIGQLGVGTWFQGGNFPREERAEMLGLAMQHRGHKVYIMGTAPFVTKRLTHHQGLTLIPRLSFNPQGPGGWLYILLSLLKTWRLQPDIVHLQGWRALSLSWLAALLVPEATLVATLDTVPSKHYRAYRLITGLAKSVCDVIVVPSRTLQYQLRQYLSLSTTYIPDGFQPLTSRPVPAKHWQLRKGQYLLLLAEEKRALQAVVRAHVATKRKKDIVVSGSDVPSLTRRHSFLKFIAAPTNRPLQSLCAHAAAVVLADASIPSATVLAAMYAGHPIIAINHPRYQELLGTTGHFYKASDQQHLQKLLKNFSRSKLGAAARKRAARHFTWARVASEYAHTYAPEAVRTIDAIVSPAKQLSVIAK